VQDTRIYSEGVYVRTVHIDSSFAMYIDWTGSKLV
jgi:hypothetical protein